MKKDNIKEWDIEPDNTYLVGISKAGNNKAKQAEDKEIDPDDRPRPDGLLQFKRRNNQETSPISIFLEVKTGNDTLSTDEMGQYRGALGLGSPEYDDHGRGIEWREVYRVLQKNLERTTREPDEFLLREFAQYLAWFELDHTIAAHDGTYPKKLKITGYPVEDRNKLRLKFIWDRKDGSNSQSPAFSAAELNTCLSQIPQDVRKEAFVGGDLGELESWARLEFGNDAVDSGQRIAVTPAEEDGATVHYIVLCCRVDLSHSQPLSD
ncbi:MAG: hypothetical protein ABEI86_11650 [Halobacteriaceae archaeon]